MTEQIQIADAISRLVKADDILLLCHKNPDGDTIGSAGALYWALKTLGKQAAVLCADGIPAQYGYMEIPAYTGQFTPRYIVAVDVASIQLFGDAIRDYTQRVDLCIDHHPSNAGYALETLLDAEAAATAELLYRLIPSMGVQLTPRIADCLYTGLSTDTGCFRFSNTTAKTHQVAAGLIGAGARVEELNTILFESKSRERMEIERIALNQLEYHFDGRCALIWLTRDQIAGSAVKLDELENLTSLPRMIEGVQAGLTLRQQPGGSWKISVRTQDGVDACAIARRLGGGGHSRAAGCELEGNLANTKAAILAEVEREFNALSKAAGEK